jgi:hypothetical protein
MPIILFLRRPKYGGAAGGHSAAAAME